MSCSLAHAYLKLTAPLGRRQLTCLQQQPPSGLQTSTNNFTVLQPGSSVATALSEGEAKRKHCFLLEVNRDEWRLESVPLRTVRPFQFDSVRGAMCPLCGCCRWLCPSWTGCSCCSVHLVLYLHTTKRLQGHKWP